MSTPDIAKLFDVFLDSDGPVADFHTARVASGMTSAVYKHSPGAYLWLPVQKGAESAISRLKVLDDKGLIRVWVATKPPSGSPYAYAEKALWYRRHFPWLEDRVIVTQDKHLLGQPGDFLLDDRPHKAHAVKFRGTFVYFDPNDPQISWVSFVGEVRNRVTAMEMQQS